MSDVTITIRRVDLRPVVELMKESQKHAVHAMWAWRLVSLFSLPFLLEPILRIPAVYTAFSLLVAVMCLFVTCLFQRWQIRAMSDAADLLIQPFKELPDD